MTGVLGMTQLALDTELTEEQREYLEMAQSSAESLMVVINDVLDFSKIEMGKLELYPQEFNLRYQVPKALQIFVVKARETDIEVSVSISDNVPEMVVGDPDRLRQIITNLVGNSMKFTERGSIELSVSLRSQTEKEAELVFVVKYTGTGIPSDALASIFDPFTHADGSLTRSHGGTGLGLAITKTLVELMDGQIEVESVEGQGTTVQFTVMFGRTASSTGSETYRAA